MKKPKQKLKNILLLFASLVLISCSEELFDNHLHNHDVDKNQITFKQFKNETGLKDFNSIKAIKISSENSRMSESEFLTDTTKVLKHTSTTNEITYCFKIYPLFDQLNSKEYYNLVYEKNGNEWNEVIFLNTEKANTIIGESKLETSQMIYNGKYPVESMSGFCEVITYSFHCTQTGSCASGTCDQCSLCVDETVNYVYCGSQLVGGSHPIESLTGGGSPSGGIGEYDGIYIPNPYDGEADLNNEEFLLAVQVANFTKTLPANLKNLMANNFWFYPNILDFIKNNGGLTQVNKDAVVFTLNNIEAIFTTISQNPNNLTSTQINEIKYNAFIFLLQHGAWLAGQSATTQQSIKNYLITNSFSTTSREDVKNWKDVNILLSQNSNILLDVPCNQLPYWQTISQHEVPNTVKTKIQNIDNQTGWFTSANIQSLGHPNNGATVNMDFFPVTISQMPKWPSGIPYTQKELFNHIRLNINDFFDDLTFTPVVNSSYGLNETALWNSTNPLGTLLDINIPIDHGTVVCSKYNQTTGEWYFTTVQTPWVGTHPVSGHRAFGYYTDVNGKMVIYTRGVDRFSFGTHMLGNTGATIEAANQAIAFSQGDSKWQNFQQKIATFVNQGQGNGLNGASNVNVPEKYRPDWNKVKNVLNGTQPISTLGCN